MNVIIDTNVLAGLLGRPKNLTVVKNAAEYKRGGNKFLMSPIVYFEFRRWVLSDGVDREGQAKILDRFLNNECDWVALDKPVVQKAAWIWSRYPGMRLPDADMLIAASALYHSVPVATRNRSDFDRFGVEVLNWFEEHPKATRTRRVR